MLKLTKMKLAMFLCGSLLATGVGIAAAQGIGDGSGKAAVLEKYDTNGDGKLDATERAAMRADFKAKRQAFHQKMVATYDTNGDGKLDATERAAMRDALATKAFEKMDVDHNGSISLDEFKQARGTFMRHHRHHHGGRRGGRRGQAAGSGQP
jgi:Ca2+-binding EF-hand superfamily protein